MQTTEIRTRTEFRFTGHNEVVYGYGETWAEAVKDAAERLAEPMMTRADADENGYVVEVEQRQDPDSGEWIDVQ